MPIKTPKFWYRQPYSPVPVIEKILSPLSAIYKFGSRLNLSRQNTKTAPIPVICIGNITAGGSGKTPSIIALNKLIVENKLFNAPCFLSRGYGGYSNSPRCISAHDDANETGDEPLLLASHSKTITSVNRYDGAMLAHKLGADCVLMDDGFQNQSLHKDLSFIVIDGKTGFGNKKLLPAGPLREPIDEALKRVQGVILIGDDKTDTQKIIPENIPIFKASIKSLKKFDKTLAYIGFAGLAHPNKFHDTLLENSMNIHAFHEYPDHHPYSNKEIERLISGAKANNARLIATEKDYVRIDKKYHKDIDYFPINLVWENENEILKFLQKELI